MNDKYNFRSMQVDELYTLYTQSTGVTTDTRTIGNGNIFFALKGEKFNANRFAANALEAGAAYAVIDELTDAAWLPKYGHRLILVEDVLQTLQALAGHHRQQFKCPVLAITGSNGKTTTKELTAAVLSGKYKTYTTQGNLNNHIGIPLTLLAVKPDAEFAVIEMGANHIGEIASYCTYVKPDYGLITNVGLAHTEGFGGFEGVVKGKTELYSYLGLNRGAIFVCAEHDLLKSKLPANVKIILYGKAAEAFCKGEIISTGNLLAFSITEEGKKVIIQTNLVGEYNFENAMAAFCIGKYFGVEAGKIKKALQDYVPGNNRSQQVTFGSNTVILDAYNANPSSMIEALKNFDKITAPNKIVILGEMKELGDLSASEHEKIADMVAHMPLQNRVFTGEGFAFLKNAVAVTYFGTTDELKQWFKAQNFENAHILVKGSRKNELEKLFKE